MSTQLALTFEQQRADRERTIDEQFRAFHAANPHVYSTLVQFARRARARGVERIGMKALWERLRWELHVETRTDSVEEFRLNNNFTSRYARLLMEREPDLAGMFETRELRT